MIVKVKGQQTISTIAQPAHRSLRKRAASYHKRVAVRVLRNRPPAPKLSPSVNAPAPQIPQIVNDTILKPNMIVEEGFNVFTSTDFVNDALEQGLKTRQQMLTSGLQ